jgi:hypothetical protein
MGSGTNSEGKEVNIVISMGDALEESFVTSVSNGDMFLDEYKCNFESIINIINALKSEKRTYYDKNSGKVYDHIIDIFVEYGYM